MNCSDVRNRIHPYLDSELHIEENLSILEHLNQCPPCASHFAAEENAWSRVASVLSADPAPAAIRVRLPAHLARIDRRQAVQRHLRWVLPAAAAATVLLLLTLNRDTMPPNISPAIEVDVTHAHGPLLAQVKGHWLALQDGSGTIDPAFLKKRCGYREIPADRHDCVLREIFGAGSCHIRKRFCSTGYRLTDGAAFLAGKDVRNYMLTTADTQIAIYVFDRGDVAISDLHVVADGATNGIRIERCRACQVVTLDRGDKVLILIACRETAVDPLVEALAEAY